MDKTQLFLFSSLLLAFFSSSNAQVTFYACNWTNSQNGDQYNLNPLMNNNTDYFEQTSAWKVWINVCRQLVSTLCGTNVAACQQWDPSTPAGKASLGAANSVQWVPLVRSTTQGQKGATAKFSNGGGGRAFEIDFQCMESSGIGAPSFEVETPSKFYNFQWASKYACPTNRPPPPPPGTGKGLSGGGIFLIIVAVLFVVYVVAGITYNKVRKNATGKELIPNVEFWFSLPGLVKDGVMFIVNSTCRRGGYQTVPSTH